VVDLAVPARRLAIEVDGPSHFVQAIAVAERRWLAGPARWKQRQVEGAGWAVLRVSEREWARQRAAFLRSVLDKLA